MTVGGDHTDGTRQDATVELTVTVIEAARILGVSVDAVRSRLRRATLEDEWHVRLTDRQDADSRERSTSRINSSNCRPAKTL